MIFAPHIDSDTPPIHLPCTPLIHTTSSNLGVGTTDLRAADDIRRTSWALLIIVRVAMKRRAVFSPGEVGWGWGWAEVGSG